MSNPRPQRHLAALHVVGGEVSATQPVIGFCGHCGEPPIDPASAARVCERCGMGLMLESAAPPAPGAAFLVLDRTLTVCGLSAAAERELAIGEPLAVDRPLSDLLIVADSEPGEGMSLIAAVVRASHGDADVVRVVVRPPDTYGVFFEARVAACGPPPAALVVLE